MDAHDLRARMRPHRNRLERYATPAMAALIEDMIIAAMLEPLVVTDDQAPRDETHDSIDAGTGTLTFEAAARRAELKAEAEKQAPSMTLAVQDPLPAQAGKDTIYPSHPGVEAANRELGRAGTLTPEDL